MTGAIEYRLVAFLFDAPITWQIIDSAVAGDANIDFAGLILDGTQIRFRSWIVGARREFRHNLAFVSAYHVAVLFGQAVLVGDV